MIASNALVKVLRYSIFEKKIAQVNVLLNKNEKNTWKLERIKCKNSKSLLVVKFSARSFLLFI